MSTLLIKNIKQLCQVRTGSTPFLKGKEMKTLPITEHAWLTIENGRIVDFGAMKDCPKDCTNEIDANNGCVLPSWVDSHTHLVFAAPREEEFVMRIKGQSYEEIAEAGGGILNSARKLQNMSFDELYQQAEERLKYLISIGTGTIEIKSGYGLNVESEIKMLEVIQKLKENYALPIKATLLAAHALPQEFKADRSAFIDIVLKELIPEVGRRNLANYIDVFCEQGFFTPAETAQILKRGAEFGLKAKIHANQLAVSGGVQVGIANNAISVDHLEEVTQVEIDALKASDTIPVALPGCSFFLGIPFAPVRKMIDNDLGVVLASDYNPGSTPSGNMNFVTSLACVKMKLTPEEAINAITINAAHALELGDEVGSIAKGKRANLIITKPISSYNYIPYSFGENVISKVLINGQVQ